MLHSSILNDKVNERCAPISRNICAVIVTYHPQGDFLARLRAVKHQVASMVIVDNASHGAALACLNEAAKRLEIPVIRNESNQGVGAALNQGANWAVDNGFSWLLTLDQDTHVAEEFIPTLLQSYWEFSNRERIAVIGSSFVDPVTNAQSVIVAGDKNRPWKEVETAITSGSLISLAAFRTIRPFREDFFVDCVDFEYCLRARSMGFHVLMACKPLMQHSIGAATCHSLPWKITATSNHSPARRYYMTRNQIVLARRYFWTEPKWIISMLYRHLKETILLCLFEQNVASKLKSIALGAWDGLSSNLHRRVS